MLNNRKVDVDRAMLLVVDFQTKLVPHIEEAEEMLAAAARLIRGAHLFGLPILATVQYSKGLGPLHRAVAEPLEAAGVTPLEKAAFSACADDVIRARLTEVDRPQVILCGIEAPVCVLQTALDLLAMGCAVFLCADAVGSRRDLDLDLGLSRAQHAGVVVTTTESVLFELCHESGTEKFKKLLEIVK